MPRIDTDLQVQLVPGGPGLLKVLPCEYGTTGHCVAGRHEQCTYSPGGHMENGHLSPAGYLTRRDATVVVDYRDSGAAIQILPMHTWRCPCACHTTILTLF